MKGSRLYALLLAGLLQAAPFARTFVSVDLRALAPSSWAWVLQVGAGAVALLGSYDAVSGATQIVAPYTVNGTVGVPYSRQLTTSGQTAHSWSANTAALGSSVFPLTPGLWLTNSNGKIGGTPTWAGTSNITISAWENSGNKGASVNALFVFTITNSVSGPSPPGITTQPLSQTNYVGSAVTFSVGASGTAPLSYQWRFQGGVITNATSSSFTLAAIQAGDAGNYSVVVTNAGGSTTSSNAALVVKPLSADLAASIAGPTTAAAGAVLNYTVSLTNLGPTLASNVVLTETLAPGTVFVSATGGGLAAGGQVAWPAIPRLPAGSGTNFTLTLSLPIDGSFTNVVQAGSATADPNPGNNNGSAAASRVATIVQPVADLAVLASGPAGVLAGGNISYTIIVTNLGPSTAQSISVTDTLPAGVTFASATGGGALSGGLVTWPAFPTLAAGAAVTLGVTVIAPAAGSLTNRAACGAATPDPVSANNDGTSDASAVTTQVGRSADLAVLVSGPASVLPGSNVTYTVMLTNLGPTLATNIVVVDSLPVGGIFVSANGGGVPGLGLVTWPTIASLAVGGSSNFSVTIQAPLAGSFTNSAQASADSPDPNPANNSGTDAASRWALTVTPQADLVVNCSGSPLASAGSMLTYTLSVTNLGPSTAANVSVQDRLPAGAGFVSATGGGIAAGGVVNWPAIGSLGAGASASFSLTVNVPASGILTNTASGTSSAYDPLSANNDGTSPAATVVTTVQPEADLATLISGPSVAAPGGAISYTITVTNLGPSPASNVVISNTFSPNATFANAPGATVSNNTVTWSGIVSLPGGRATNVYLSLTAPNSGTVTNTVSAFSGTPDPNPANNDGSLPASTLTTVITAVQFGLGSSAINLNPQTGLYEQIVTVTNTGPSTVAALRVEVTGLRADVGLYNASGMNAGVPYVQYNLPLNPSQFVSLRLEFYVSDRLPFTDSLAVEEVLPAVAPPVSGAGFLITSVFVDARVPGTPRLVIQFPTTPGRVYTIVYRDSLAGAWKVATPSVTAASSLTQWYDDGPPKTDSAPSGTNSSRLYQVIANP